MDTLRAWAINQESQNNEPKVFDWHKAAKLIAKKRPKEASAGLSQDWDFTGDTIYTEEEGIPGFAYTYLMSTWATPELCMDGETVDCYVRASEQPDWNAETFWPDSARELFHRRLGE